MPQPGSVIGGYCIESGGDIGKGGFGKVYRARAPRDGAIVALKLVSLNNDEAVAAERTGARLQQRFMRTHGITTPVEFVPEYPTADRVATTFAIVARHGLHSPT